MRWGTRARSAEGGRSRPWRMLRSARTRMLSCSRIPSSGTSYVALNVHTVPRLHVSGE